MPVTIETGQRESAHGLRIGLINNMPDSALGSTERQFVALLEGVSRHTDVQLELYYLPGVPRAAAAREWRDERYRSVEALLAGPGLDGLIVTGAEPRMPHLTQEPYWGELLRVLDWAEDNTASTVWSCLAAHAAVLAQDGIERMRQADKVFGLLDCTQNADHHALLAGLPPTFSVPHSRWNDLAEEQLAASSYQVLTRTEHGQVDMFVRQRNSLFVYFQGHPEYEADTLLREYRRDVARFLRGESERAPLLPLNCCEEAAPELASLLAEDRLADIAKLVGKMRPPHAWHSAAVAIYRNWLALIADARTSRANAADVPAIPAPASSLTLTPFIPE